MTALLPATEITKNNSNFHTTTSLALEWNEIQFEIKKLSTKHLYVINLWVINTAVTNFTKIIKKKIYFFVYSIQRN
jgi:hypothetical protein